MNILTELYISVFSLPEWARVTLNSNHTLEYLAAVHLETFTHTLELKKLEAGSIIKEMLDRFENKSQSILHPDHSLWIYSAHDLSLVNILNALNLYEVCSYKNFFFHSQVFVETEAKN